MFIKFRDDHHILYASIKLGEGINLVLKNDYHPRGQFERDYKWKDLLPARKEKAVALVLEIEAKIEELRQLL